MQVNLQSDNPLTILFLESSMNWGGQEDRTINEMKWLQNHGHFPVLGCHRDSGIAKHADASGLNVQHVSMRSNFDVSGFFQLVSLVRRIHPDVVHAHSSKDAWFSLWLHQFGVPVVRSRHTLQSSKIPYGRQLIYRHGCRRLIASAKTIASNMHAVTGIPSDRIDVIGESVRPDIFFPGDAQHVRDEFGIPRNAILFAVVGMLREEKGQRYFVKAAREVLNSRPDVRFLIVGSSAKSKNVETEIVNSLSSDFSDFVTPPIIMTGFRRDVPEIMRAIDCLVVPSSKEAQSLVIPQAFASGKPAIGSRVGGIPELIQDGVNGLLFESKNIHALSEAMLKLVSSPDLIKSLGEHALAFARAELTADQKMLQLLASYRRTIASNP